MDGRGSGRHRRLRPARHRRRRHRGAGRRGDARHLGTQPVERPLGALGRLKPFLPGQIAGGADLTEGLAHRALEHSPGAPVGFAEVSVLPDVEQRLVDVLSARGWRIAGAS